MRKLFAEFIKSRLQQRENLVVLLGDISVGLFLDKNEELPLRVHNIGILEQSMISLAAGMSDRGYDVVIHTISPFIIERAYEQIKLDIGYNKKKVIMVSANGPADYSKLGPTHHCFSDIPLLKLIPDIEVYLPGQKADVVTCLDQALNSEVASYIRLTSRNVELLAKNCVVNKTNHQESDVLNVFFGESLKYYELNKIKLNVDDWIYSYKLEDIDLIELNKYKTIIFWEPYSSPIAALFYRQRINTSIEIFSMIYPLVYEDGIFEHPGFSRVKV